MAPIFKRLILSLIFLKPFEQKLIKKPKHHSYIECQYSRITTAVHPAVSQICMFSMRNDHEKGFSSILFFLFSFPVFLPIYRISLPASVLPFPLCISTFLHFLSIPFSLSPSILFFFPVSVYWGQVDVSGIHSPLFVCLFSACQISYGLQLWTDARKVQDACTHAPQNRVPPRPVSAAILICFLSCKLRKSNKKRLAGERRRQWDASFFACGDCPVTLPGGTDSRTPDGCLFEASGTGLRLTALRDM